MSAFAQQAGDLPVRPQIRRQPGRGPLASRPGESVAERGPDIRVLGAHLAEPRQLIGVLIALAELRGQPEEVRDVAFPRRGSGPGFGQQFRAELANRVEQPVPRIIAPRAQHHRLVHQADQGRQDVRPVKRVASADFFGRTDAERVREHRQPGPQQLLGGRAQMM